MAVLLDVRCLVAVDGRRLMSGRTLGVFLFLGVLYACDIWFQIKQQYVPWFDSVEHWLGGCLVACAFIDKAQEWLIPVNLLTILAMVTLVGVVWELGELPSFVAGVFGEGCPYHNTMSDLVFDMIGGMTVWLINTFE
jgi:hypothetical protein